MRAGWVAMVAASISSFSNVVLPTCRSCDGHRRARRRPPRARRRAPCRPGPGRGRPASGRAGVGVRDAAGLAPAGRSASDRARGSRARSRAISSVVMTTSSRSVLPGMAIDPWTMRRSATWPGSRPPAPPAARGRAAGCAARASSRRPDRRRRRRGRQVDARPIRGQDRHEVVVGRAAGQGLEVVRAIDRGAVVAVVRARDDDRADLGLAEALELARRRVPPSGAAGRCCRTGRPR